MGFGERLVSYLLRISSTSFVGVGASRHREHGQRRPPPEQTFPREYSPAKCNAKKREVRGNRGIGVDSQPV
jgi:hypothetical protein